MNGGSVPYHLRTNKAIDRQVFFELLGQLKLPNNIQTYRYISLGGPMLEDHHNLHHHLGVTKLESLERDSSVFSRQQFNKNYNCINCINTTVENYINNFERRENTILWLDYTDTQWGKQFLDFHTVLGKLDEYDICKITINANPDTLIDNSEMNYSKDVIFKKKSAGKFLNENISINDVSSMPALAKTLSSILETVSQNALDLIDNLSFQPITLFRYIDNKHHMLSLTGIIVKKNGPKDLTALLSESHLDVRPHISNSWDDIHEINVPDLTYRERFEINRMLPADNNNIDMDSLPFKIDKNKIKSTTAIKNYIKYYRYIPNFQKVSM